MTDLLGEALARYGDTPDEEAYVYCDAKALFLLVAAARNWHTLTQRGEKIWVCHYPEFNDPYCQSGIGNPQPDKTRLPRKHIRCGYYWQVPVDALTDTAREDE